MNPAAAHAESRFAELAEAWLADGGPDALDHPAAREVVGMGWAAVPLLLAELESRPGPWTLALAAITGVEPPAVGGNGDLGPEARAWLAWGRELCYLPDDLSVPVDEAEEARLYEEALRITPTVAQLREMIAKGLPPVVGIDFDSDPADLY